MRRNIFTVDVRPVIEGIISLKDIGDLIVV